MERPPASDALSTSGLALGVGCYLMWGFAPVYWKAVDSIPSHETLVVRILWTLALMIVVLVAGGRTRELHRSAASGLGFTIAAAALLALNWGVFIHAVQSGRVLDTSLGYFINPLMSVLLGTLVLGERLSRVQSASVGLAGAGVAWMTIQMGELPWIALVLAACFALYGLIHKLRPRPPLGGLVIEMLVLSPFALAALAWMAAHDAAALASAGPATHALVALSGPVTALPLLFFHAATRRLPLVVVGMFQYIAPTLSFLLATVHYHEPFTRHAALGFALVWSALGLFLYDAARRVRALDAR